MSAASTRRAGAAQKIGIAHKGVARVKIKKLPARADSDRASL